MHNFFVGTVRRVAMNQPNVSTQIMIVLLTVNKVHAV